MLILCKGGIGVSVMVWTNKYGEWEVGGGPGVVLESRSGEEEASGAAVVVCGICVEIVERQIADKTKFEEASSTNHRYPVSVLHY